MRFLELFDWLTLKTTALTVRDLVVKCPDPAKECWDRGDDLTPLLIM